MSDRESELKPMPRTLKELALDDRIDDDTLFAFAESCSDRGIRLRAEMALRMRYPSDVNRREP